MKTLKYVIAFVLIPIIVVLMGYTLNKKSPDVKFTLSKGIPISPLEESIPSISAKTSVQELVVKNLGNSKAEYVQVKINKEVVKYNLIRNFASDEPKITRFCRHSL